MMGSTLTPKAPAATGAFYFFNHSQSIKNVIQYLAPSPTFSAKLEPLSPLKQISNISTNSKGRHLFLQLY